MAEFHLKDVRMTVTGHIRSISAQYSVSNIAMASSLENVENRLSKFGISLNTGFRLEFPGQDVLYVYFGNFLGETPSNTCSASWFEHVYIFATASSGNMLCRPTDWSL